MHLNIEWVFIKHGLNYLHMFKDILTLQSMLYYQLVMNDIKISCHDIHESNYHDKSILSF